MEEFFSKKLLDLSPVAVFVCDENFKFLYINNIAQKFIEKFLIAGEDLKSFVNVNESKILTKEDSYFNVISENLEQNNTAFYVSKNVLESRIVDAEKFRSVESFRSKMLGEMAGGLSHEINTPLGSIILCSDLLHEIIKSKNDIDDDMLEIVTDIKDAAEGISDVIRSFKFFVRDDRPDQFVFFSVNDLIVKIQNLFKLQMLRHDVQFLVDNQIEDEQCVIECNPTKIAQVLANLVKNSLDEIEASDERWIKLTAIGNESIIQFLVEDSGPGVQSENLKNIFRPLFTTKEICKGSGIGLSICQEFVSEHGGDIRYDEAKDVTCFEVNLPKIQNK